MLKVAIPLLLVISPFVLFGGSTPKAEENTNTNPDYIHSTQSVETQTRFAEEIESTTQSIAYPTEYQDNEEKEYGAEEVLQEGVNGVRTEFERVTYWKGEEIYRAYDRTETQDPVPRIIDRGTKIVWRELDTPEYGRVKYWGKLEGFMATSYDGNCAGCRGLTYSGTPVVKGVCATDPRTIALGTNFYVPGYGICRAEDIGGAIKGKRVDLGYESVDGNWWKRYVDIYLLTNEPK